MKNKMIFMGLSVAVLLLGAAIHAQAQGNIPIQQSSPTRFDDCQKNAKTMIETEACIVAEEKAIRDDLEKMVAQLTAGAIQGDQKIPGYDIAKKLQNSNQSFVAYMKDQCDYIKARYTNGSIAGTAYTACMTTLMKERYNMLKPE